ncbi:MAG: ABC transporter permease [Candidatus Bathyarchaeia archaeon]
MGVKRYIAGRILFVFFAVWVVASFNYIVFYHMIGDPVLLLIRKMPLDEETIKILRARWGLDKPPIEQYFRYVINMFMGDFGLSFRSFRPVAEEILEKLPNTLTLMGSGFVISTVLKLLIGLKIASRRGKMVDMTTLGVSLGLGAVPVFWLGMIFLLIFSFGLGLFPCYGTISDPPNNPKDPISFIIDYLWHLTLPLTTLTIIMTGSGLLGIRNLVLDALSQDYVIAARAKGAPERLILYKHVLKNVAIPVVTGIAGSIGAILGGAPTTETVFSWYGLGRYMVESLRELDWPAVQGSFFIMAIITIFGNLAADIIYTLIDPRVRVGGKVYGS